MRHGRWGWVVVAVAAGSGCGGYFTGALSGAAHSLGAGADTGIEVARGTRLGRLGARVRAGSSAPFV